MTSSLAAKQIAFRMSSYNGFATRCPHPDQPLRHSPNHSNYLVIFVRVQHRAPGHVPGGGLQSQLPPATLVNTKLTRAFDVKDWIRRFRRGSPQDAVSEPFTFPGA